MPFFSDTIWAVIFAGLLAMIPTIVLRLLDLHDKRKQRKHDLHLKEIELFYTAKMEAIQEFMSSLGRYGCFMDVPDYKSLPDINQSSSRLLPFLSTEARNAVHFFVLEVEARSHDKFANLSNLDHISNFERMVSLLFKEIQITKDNAMPK
jgi:hypothetical protein